MEQEKLPTIWFTLNNVYNHCLDLNMLINGSDKFPTLDDKAQAVTWQRKLFAKIHISWITIFMTMSSYYWKSTL